jgi:hypothetical protein
MEWNLILAESLNGEAINIFFQTEDEYRDKDGKDIGSVNKLDKIL